MAKRRNTPTSDDGEFLEKVKEALAKEPKKSTNVKKTTAVKKGRAVKVGLNSTKKKMDAKVKANNNTESVIVPSGTTLDVAGKVRKRKVDTH